MTGHLVAADDLGKDICEMLGLPNRSVRAIRLDLKAGDVATISVDLFVDQAQGERILETLKFYAWEQAGEGGENL